MSDIKLDRQGIEMTRTAMARKRKRNNFFSYLLVAIVICLIAVIVLFQTQSVKTKLDTYTAEDQELDEKIAAEQARTEELEQFSKEVQTDAYAEEQAQEKLKLLKENQIMFVAE